jgi:aspartyl-tRNA(Asn)/glutamyl-tRNA(Gln) amidotransferase subunit A
MSTRLPFMTINEAAPLLAGKVISPVELTRAFLERIDAFDSSLRSYVLVLHETAMDAARAVELEILAGRYRGPLHGIPVALKDIYGTRGIRTTACSRLMADHVPDTDAFAWKRLADAGAILLGKLENHEFALGGPASDGLFPHARNPWNREHYSGGSSSGCGVALAAGLCMGALGTDTGGSIRSPASYCGIAGLTTTSGLVSRGGVVPLSFSLDNCGPMAWTAEDCAYLLGAVAGHDADDPSSVAAPPVDYADSLGEDLHGLRIGYVRHFSHHDLAVGAEVNRAVEAALGVLAELGAEVSEVEFPSLADFSACNMVIMMSEAFAIHERDLRERPEAYTGITRDRLSLGAFLSATDYVEAQRLRRELVSAYRAVLERVDAVICPASPSTAPRTVEMEARKFAFLEQPLITTPFNCVGAPAVAVCCGFDGAGLPIGMQVGGGWFGDATVLRVADAYERATPWRQRRPLS